MRRIPPHIRQELQRLSELGIELRPQEYRDWLAKLAKGEEYDTKDSALLTARIGAARSGFVVPDVEECELFHEGGDWAVAYWPTERRATDV